MLDRGVVQVEELGPREDGVVERPVVSEVGDEAVRVRVGPDAHEPQGDGVVAPAARVQERRVARLVVGLELGAQGQQLGDGVPDGRGLARAEELAHVVQGVVVGRVGLVDVEVGLHGEQLDDGDQALGGGRVQRRVVPAGDGIEAQGRPAEDEQLGYLALAVAHGQVQGAPPRKLVRRVQQLLVRLDGPAIAHLEGGGIDIDPVVEEVRDDVPVAAHRRCVERCAVLAELPRRGRGRGVVPVRVLVAALRVVAVWLGEQRAVSGARVAGTKLVQVGPGGVGFLYGAELAVLGGPEETRRVARPDVVLVQQGVDDAVEEAGHSAQRHLVLDVQELGDEQDYLGGEPQHASASGGGQRRR